MLILLLQCRIAKESIFLINWILALALQLLCFWNFLSIISCYVHLIFSSSPPKLHQCLLTVCYIQPRLLSTWRPFPLAWILVSSQVRFSTIASLAFTSTRMPHQVPSCTVSCSLSLSNQIQRYDHPPRKYFHSYINWH